MQILPSHLWEQILLYLDFISLFIIQPTNYRLLDILYKAETKPLPDIYKYPDCRLKKWNIQNFYAIINFDNTLKVRHLHYPHYFSYDLSLSDDNKFLIIRYLKKHQNVLLQYTDFSILYLEYDYKTKYDQLLIELFKCSKSDIQEYRALYQKKCDNRELKLLKLL